MQGMLSCTPRLLAAAAVLARSLFSSAATLDAAVETREELPSPSNDTVTTFLKYNQDVNKRFNDNPIYQAVGLAARMWSTLQDRKYMREVMFPTVGRLAGVRKGGAVLDVGLQVRF